MSNGRSLLRGLVAAWSLVLLGLVVCALIPSPGVWFWYVRVALPELAIGLLFLGAPLLLVRGSRPVYIILCLFGLWPWVHAVGIAGGIPRRYPENGPAPRAETIAGVPVLRYPASPSGPRAKARRLTIVYVHGGSWNSGHPDDYPAMFSQLSGLGWDILSVDYRLAPKHPYPAALDDIRKVADSVDRSILIGRSAGNHLALLAGYTGRNVRGVVAFYPPVDMVWSYEHPSNPRVLDSRAALRQFLGGTPAEKPAVYREASPIAKVSPDTPPTLLFHGLRDQLVYPRQSRMLWDEMRRQGAPCELLETSWSDHGGDIFPQGPMARLAMDRIVRFLETLEESP